MNETSKCFARRVARGDFKRYLSGKGIDIGCGPDLLRSMAITTVKSWDKADGDAQLLETCRDEEFDFAYSSHCLERMRDIKEALTNWIRVVRVDGFIYIVVPDYVLYEKMRFPSRFNPDHKHTFSMDLKRRKVARYTHWNIESDLVPIIVECGVAVSRVELEDFDFDYNVGPDIDQTMSEKTLAQICIIGRKVR